MTDDARSFRAQTERDRALLAECRKALAELLAAHNLPLDREGWNLPDAERYAQAVDRTRALLTCLDAQAK